MSHFESRDLFKKGQKRMDAPVTSADLDEAQQLFCDAYIQDPSFHRALAWQGYALVRKFTEGYAEAGAVLDEALRLTQGAVDAEDDDYDNQWALAIAQLYKEDWAASNETYQLAMRLDIEGNVHLLGDYAVALVYFGETRKALRYAWKTKDMRDWHRWNTAWAYFFLGRPEFQSSGDSIYFDLAVRKIERMVLKPGHPRYLAQAQLLLGAIYTLKGDTSAATNAMTIYWSDRPQDWTIDMEMALHPFDPGNTEAAANRAFWEEAAGQALAIPI